MCSILMRLTDFTVGGYVGAETFSRINTTVFQEEITVGPAIGPAGRVDGHRSFYAVSFARTPESMPADPLRYVAHRSTFLRIERLIGCNRAILAPWKRVKRSSTTNWRATFPRSRADGTSRPRDLQSRRCHWSCHLAHREAGHERRWREDFIDAHIQLESTSQFPSIPL